MSTVGQGVLGVVGAVIGFYIPGGYLLMGLSIGLTIGGILFPPTVDSGVMKPGGLNLQTSQLGISVPVIYGTQKVSGNLIQYGNFTANEQRSDAGKGGGGSVVTGYDYHVDLAWGICMSPPDRRKTILNVWVGADPVAASAYIIYDGSQTEANSWMAGFTERPPVWKNLCWVYMPDYSLGNSPYIPQFTFEVEDVGGANPDMLPADISYDVLTNDLYGLGLSTTYIDAAAKSITNNYCLTNDLLVSMIFNSQISVLDVLRHVVQHHDGYITYKDGKIAHNQAQFTTPTVFLSHENGDFVETDDKPIEVSKVGERGYYNRISVEYANRGDAYASAIAMADDDTDIDQNRLKDATIKLDGFCQFERAEAMAWLLLKKSLIQPQALKFKLGPKSRAVISAGMIITVTDPHTGLVDLPARILSINEAADKTIAVEAIEENEMIYDHTAAGKSPAPIAPPENPNLHAPAEAVQRSVGFLLDSYYSGTARQILIASSKPINNPSWGGASVYRSYFVGGSYSRKLSLSGSGIIGDVSSVEYDSSGELLSVTVILDINATLASAISYEELIADIYKNLFYVMGKGYGKFQTVDLVGVRTWELTDVLWDVTESAVSGAEIVEGDVVMFYGGTMSLLTLNSSEVGRTLYFKTPSFNLYGAEQSLANVDPITVEV